MLAMKQLMLLCFTLSLFLTPTLSAATVEHDKGWGGMDGNDLLPACQAGVEQLDGKSLSSGRAFDAGRCLFYVSGFLDGLSVRESFPDAPPMFCFRTSAEAWDTHSAWNDSYSKWRN